MTDLSLHLTTPPSPFVSFAFPVSSLFISLSRSVGIGLFACFCPLTPSFPPRPLPGWYWLEYGRKWRLWSRKALLALHFVIFWLILNNWNKWEMASAHYVLDMKARLLQPPCSRRSDLGSMIRLHPINWHRIGVMRRSMTDSHHGIPRAQLL